MKRGLKRSIIVFIYLMIFGIVGLVIYQIAKPNPTCWDGKQNQGEEGIDCGGPCQLCEREIKADDMVVLEKYFVHGKGNYYDVMSKVDNPNNRFGAAKFSYKFSLVDNAGNKLSTRMGESFILPGETKYVIELNMDSPEEPYTVNFEITDVEWEEFLGYEEPKLSIYNKNFHKDGQKSEVFGLLKNESYFDFNSIEIDIVLRDGDGKPLALGTNEMRTISSQQERDFRIFWPYTFPKEVEEVEIRAEADVFDLNNSYVKQYRPQHFQDYGEN